MEEIEKDIADISQLLTQATRDNSRAILKSELSRLQTRLDSLNKPTFSTTEQKPIGTVPLPHIKLTTYAWDQSEKFVKLYVTMPGAHKAKPEDIVFEATNKSFVLRCHNVAGKDYEMTICGLLSPIVPEDSKAKAKEDMVVVMLKKQKEKNSWETVTEQEFMAKEKKKPKFDKDEDPQVGLMKMMKDLYEDGDDEMKRTIKKAWWEANENKTKGTRPPMDL